MRFSSLLACCCAARSRSRRSSLCTIAGLPRRLRQRVSRSCRGRETEATTSTFRGRITPRDSDALRMILEVRDLTKLYPGVRAVDGISFAITEATCFGLLGPNGAGKTTTVEMIEGVTAPTGGEMPYRGRPRARDFRERIGIQFQKTALPDFLTVREVLVLFAALYRRSLPIEGVVRQCSLEELVGRQATKISGGQLQRLLVALALVNDPEIL